MLFQDPDFNPEDIDWKSLPGGLKKKMKKIFIETLNDFDPCFSRKKQKMYLRCYMKGLLSTHIKRKNEQQIALAFMGSKKVREMERFMNKSTWAYKNNRPTPGRVDLFLLIRLNIVTGRGTI